MYISHCITFLCCVSAPMKVWSMAHKILWLLYTFYEETYLMNLNITVWCFIRRVTCSTKWTGSIHVVVMGFPYTWIEYVYKGGRDGMLKLWLNKNLPSVKCKFMRNTRGDGAQNAHLCTVKILVRVRIFRPQDKAAYFILVSEFVIFL